MTVAPKPFLVILRMKITPVSAGNIRWERMNPPLPVGLVHKPPNLKPSSHPPSTTLLDDGCVTLPQRVMTEKAILAVFLHARVSSGQCQSGRGTVVSVLVQVIFRD